MIQSESAWVFPNYLMNSKYEAMIEWTTFTLPTYLIWILILHILSMTNLLKVDAA